MHRPKLAAIAIALALLASACGGDSNEITASTCDEVVDETLALFQRLIDDIDADFEDLGIADFVDQGAELESFAQFREDAVTIEQLSEDLGCVDAEVGAGVSSRVGILTSETVVGRFVIDAVISGGL